MKQIIHLSAGLGAANRKVSHVLVQNRIDFLIKCLIVTSLKIHQARNHILLNKMEKRRIREEK